MADPTHAKQTSTQGIHSIVAYRFRDEADRLVFDNEQSGNPKVAVPPGPGDVGKVAFQIDNGTYWLLVDDSPITWSALSVVFPWTQQEFTPTTGQVSFILSLAPTDVETVTLTVNGVVADEGTDYTISGVTITWLDAEFTMQMTDLMSVRYR